MAAQAEPLRVAIVGGGGQLIAQAHIPSADNDVLWEKPKFAEIGAGVVIGPNALAALRLLGLSEQMEVLANCPPHTENFFFEYRFAETAHPHCEELITGVTGKDTGKGNVHRAEFLDKLIEKVPAQYCYFDHRFVDYRFDGTATILQFANGKEATVDLILACDGIKSPIRKTLYSHLGIDKSNQQEKYAEWVAWRGLITAEEYELAMGRSGAFPVMWLGLDRHILTFPVKRGQFVNIVGFVRDPEHKKLGGRTGPWAEERPKEEMLSDFQGFNSKCQSLLRAIAKPSIWGIFDLPPMEVVSGEATILCGDAAHATTPHQGSGAGQAIEDSLFLSRLLGHPAVWQNRDLDRLGKAIACYRKYRHERAAQVQITSAQAGMLYEGRGHKGEGQDISKVRQGLEGRMKWVWEYDIQGNLDAMRADLDLL